MGFNNSPKRYPVNSDDEATAALLEALANGPTTVAQLAKAVHKSSGATCQRLYRLEKKGLVGVDGGHHGSRRYGVKIWGLVEHISQPEAPKPKGCPPRRLPHWGATTLSYDLDKHRRLAMLAR